MNLWLFMTVSDTPLKLASVVGVGMFLSTLDSGIINIAIPTLLKVFKTDISILIWSVSLYTLVLSATILLFGRLADRFGRLMLYEWGLSLFAISSLFCGFASNVWMLILFRALQGIGAAMMQATTLAILSTRLTGQAFAKAMGIFGLILGLGPLMGPVVGGVILSYFNWSWIFWINIPVCLLGLYGCKQLQPHSEILHTANINYLNLLCLGISLFLLLLTLNVYSKNANAFHVVLLITFMTLIFYGVLEIKTKQPIIQFSLFKKLNFTAPMLGIIAFGGATAVTFMLPPLYFEKLRAYEAWQVGIISFAAPLGVVVSARYSTYLSTRIGRRNSMLIGLFIFSSVLLSLSQIQLDWSVILVFLLLLLYGIGGGIFQTPCYMYLVSQFPVSEQAFISALTRMIQNLAIAIEATSAAALISFKSKSSNIFLLNGIQHAWMMSSTIALVALMISAIAFKNNRLLTIKNINKCYTKGN